MVSVALRAACNATPLVVATCRRHARVTPRWTSMRRPSSAPTSKSRMNLSNPHVRASAQPYPEFLWVGMSRTATQSMLLKPTGPAARVGSVKVGHTCLLRCRSSRHRGARCCHPRFSSVGSALAPMETCRQTPPRWNVQPCTFQQPLTVPHCIITWRRVLMNAHSKTCGCRCLIMWTQSAQLDQCGATRDCETT